MTAPEDLMRVEHLQIRFRTPTGPVTAVHDLSFSIGKGRVVGLVGESGCGKSVTGLSLMGLLPQPAGQVSRGKILFQGKDLVPQPEEDWQELRGNRIAMVFQDPMTSLNPVFTVGQQIDEALALHRGLDKKAQKAETLRLLGTLGLPTPERIWASYPHTLSGGMRQRVMIALALSCEPDLLIADEPTTALDVTIQAQILDLLRTINETRGTSILLVTHDLGVIAELAHEVAVIYAGRVVEQAPVQTLFDAPDHPYTQALLRARVNGAVPGQRLFAIPGQVPPAGAVLPGCPFEPRCDRRLDRCRTELPPDRAVGPGHRAACWVAEAAGE